MNFLRKLASSQNCCIPKTVLTVGYAASIFYLHSIRLDTILLVNKARVQLLSLHANVFRRPKLHLFLLQQYETTMQVSLRASVVMQKISVWSATIRTLSNILPPRATPFALNLVKGPCGE